ncbi:MAG: ATP-binding cassette domain-containing protein, partial [Gemmatimonadetes bacterium]|nr:ATP-binding cassette domain-containing protein [Gemmatimonadota bacterium]
LMVGLIWPDEGTVTYAGQDLTPANVLSLRQKMGYVIQEGGLFPHLTARKNVALMANYLGWTEDRIDSRIETLATLTHFPPDGLDRFPGELSGGQQQRVGLMRALMLDPDVLLLDEPLGALDPMIRADLQSDLRSIFQTLGKTVVMVTHDMGEAGFFGDQIVLMREGKIVQIGSLKNLTQNPAHEFVTQFIHAQRNPLESMAPGEIAK